MGCDRERLKARLMSEASLSPVRRYVRMDAFPGADGDEEPATEVEVTVFSSFEMSFTDPIVSLRISEDAFKGDVERILVELLERVRSADWQQMTAFPDAWTPAGGFPVPDFQTDIPLRAVINEETSDG